ncbi:MULTISPECIES: hypothetical protein [Rhizobium/Agrobacterium group]|uniref:hypothetical protein n=1 Tax=Rhizobium/Agrobacterium group TaxID=227290 RepID=UPI00045A2DF8|nr:MULTISPECIES: hypothetical protein [Rhizobium/Agrobacterium group]CAD7039506.1 hypothetical protein RP007_04803 [Rhizobium sp. P007]CDN95394.1 hypothetical protein BN949_04566 [Agrobacterium tumefaciens]
MKTWDDLKAKYHDLLPAHLGIQCETGWYDILDRYFEVIQREMPDGAVYEVGQIKEKMGTLRIYDSSYGETLSSVETVTEAHQLAEARSLHTCEYCGRRGRFRRRRSYLTVTCEEHATQHGFYAIPEDPEPRDYRQTADGWIVYDPDVDAFINTEPPEWAA